PDQRQYIRELKLFGVRQVYPLLLAAHHKFAAADFCKLLKVCSVISFRWNVIGSLSPSDQERTYTGIAEKISLGSINDLIGLIHELRNLYVKDDAFRAAFADKEIKTAHTRNKRIVRYILFKLEKQVSNHDYDFDSDTYNIEHILPENPGEGWEYINDNEHEQFVYRLGNMTLLQSRTNRHLGNAPF